uniref:Uncharacterized protein n=1 Tax=Arion vulgaris TaxID=1028688 RepID=A0A0B6YPV3_9EUPU
MSRAMVTLQKHQRNNSDEHTKMIQLYTGVVLSHEIVGHTKISVIFKPLTKI